MKRIIVVVDILKLELEGKLPYWLSPLANPTPEMLAKRDAIRKKNRRLTEQQQPKGSDRK